MTSSVTTSPPPPPSPPPAANVPSAANVPPAAPAGSAPERASTRARELFAGAVSGTPGRMRVLAAIALVVTLAFGVLGFLALLRFHSNVEEARRNAEQLVRIQSIRTNLVKADANATNAFLVGGLEPPAVRDAYTNGIAATARTLAQASARSDDAPALERVNRVLTQYTGLIEAARANNRQGFPVGAAYLRQASRALRDDALPALATLVQAERRRVEDSTSAADSARDALILFLVLALVALVAPQMYLSRKTRRTFNKPLLAATAVVIVAGLLGLGVVTWSKGRADEARAGPYRQTVALATARIGGFDAKSAEALTLIARGSGAAFEERFQSTAADASAAIERDLVGAAPESAQAEAAATFADYVSEHQKLRSLDENGQHDQAVAAATGNGAANQAFARFERASSRALTAEAADLSDDLNQAATPLVVTAWLLLLAGLAAAVLAWRGVSERLREYR